MDQPDCSYKIPTIKVSKGEGFSVTVAVVDQVNRSKHMNVNIEASISHGGIGEGGQLNKLARREHKNCTNLILSVLSPDNNETLMLFATDSCEKSKLNVSIQFLDCTCSIGFEPSPSNSKCKCICDSTLSPYISNCEYKTKLILRGNTNAWITFINDTDWSGFIIYPVCPFDYCHPPGENVSMNLNLPSGSDAQCAHNCSGILCGACQPNLSLSLGSSHCLSYPDHWPLVFIAILLIALIAGILLVTVFLALNMTVADGTINAIIFFASVTAPFDNSSAAPSFPAVFIAWLNLDI